VVAQHRHEDAWAKVLEVIRGTRRDSRQLVDGLTAQVLNDHYAAVSTDDDFHAPEPKQTAAVHGCFITETDVFRLLDTLKPTATGLDGIPAWFLRLKRRYSPRRWPTSSTSL